MQHRDEPDAGLRRLNERNNNFWALQNELFWERIADRPVREIALETLRSEQKRGIDPYNQISLPEALASADQAKSLFLKEISQSGELGSECDSLQDLTRGIIPDTRIETSVNAAGDLSWREFSRKGGQARERDDLQILIEKLIEEKPKMRASGLHAELEKCWQIREVIYHIEDENDEDHPKIHFLNRGKKKTAKISGLKSRFFRAKRAVLSAKKIATE